MDLWDITIIMTVYSTILMLEAEEFTPPAAELAELLEMVLVSTEPPPQAEATPAVDVAGAVTEAEEVRLACGLCVNK